MNFISKYARRRSKIRIGSNHKRLRNWRIKLSIGCRLNSKRVLGKVVSNISMIVGLGNIDQANKRKLTL